MCVYLLAQPAAPCLRSGAAAGQSAQTNPNQNQTKTTHPNPPKPNPNAKQTQPATHLAAL